MIFGVALGSMVGVVLAMTGSGGGILAVPLLVFGMHMTVSEASQISLLAVGLASALGAAIGLQARKVEIKAALLVAACGIMASPVGILVAHHIHPKVLSCIFAATLLYVAFKQMQRRSGMDGHSSQSTNQTPLTGTPRGVAQLTWNSRCVATMVTIGVLTGFVSGLLGIGGGFILVPSLCRYTGLEYRTVVATSLAVITLVAIVGSAFSTVSQHYDYWSAVPFCSGALVGMMFGKRLLAYTSTSFSSKLFSALCVISAFSFLAKWFF